MTWDDIKHKPWVNLSVVLKDDKIVAGAFIVAYEDLAGMKAKKNPCKEYRLIGRCHEGLVRR